MVPLSENPLCSVIVVSLNGERVLPTCLTSVLACEGVDFELIVVDNGSTDSTAAIVREGYPQARLIQAGRNLGFAGGNNLGMQSARGQIMILLNDDTKVPADWLTKICAPFEADPTIGSVGCKLLYPDEKTIQHAGGILLPNANTGHLGYQELDRGQWDKAGAVTYVTGAALALRRVALEQVGLLDPAFFPIYFEEVDLQTRFSQAGWKNWYEPAASLIHYESQSQGVASPRFIFRYTRNRMRYLALHGTPQGKGLALKYELRWLVDMIRIHRLWSVVRAYADGVRRWPAWRADRKTRRTVPTLGPCPARDARAVSR